MKSQVVVGELRRDPGIGRPIPLDPVVDSSAKTDLILVFRVVVRVKCHLVATLLDVGPDLVHQASDHVVGPPNSPALLDLQNSRQVLARHPGGDRGEFRGDGDMAKLPFNVMSDADRPLDPSRLRSGIG